MAATETQLRDALAEAIEVARLSQPVKVLAVYDVAIAEADLPKEPTWFVYPGRRRADLRDGVVDIVHLSAYATLAQRLPKEGRDAVVDGLITLTSEVEKLLSQQAPLDAEFVRFEDGEIGREPYNMEALRSLNTFQATLQPQYGFYD